MLSFHQYLTELFTDQLPFVDSKVVGGGTHAYTFGKGSDTVVVYFRRNTSYRAESVYDLTFTRNHSMRVTGEGKAGQVFASVIAAVEDFVHNQRPEKVIFSAEKGSGMIPSGRVKLYKAMIKKYAFKFGYSLTKSNYDPDEEPTTEYFTLVRDRD